MKIRRRSGIAKNTSPHAVDIQRGTKCFEPAGTML